MVDVITFRDGKETAEIKINKPPQCPHCEKGIDAKPVDWFIEDKHGAVHFLYVAMKCPMCEEVFWAKYQADVFRFMNYDQPLYWSQIIGGDGLVREFSEDISGCSHEFVTIYNDAYKAEQAGCSSVVGICYRLAFERLIKDFCITICPEDAEKIKEMPLKACIDKYMPEGETKGIIERTAWIGNDFAHYESRHLDMNLEDLKEMIDICVSDIETSLKRRKYNEKIQPNKAPQK